MHQLLEPAESGRMVDLHRKGGLTNSELEMAAVLLQCPVADMMRPIMDCCHAAIWADNSPATSWSAKMADEATASIAGQLLWALATCQHMTQSALPTVTHCTGSLNLLADAALRSFCKFHHGDA